MVVVSPHGFDGSVGGVETVSKQRRGAFYGVDLCKKSDRPGQSANGPFDPRPPWAAGNLVAGRALSKQVGSFVGLQVGWFFMQRLADKDGLERKSPL